MVYDIQVIRDTDKYRQNIKIKKTVVKKNLIGKQSILSNAVCVQKAFLCSSTLKGVLFPW